MIGRFDHLRSRAVRDRIGKLVNSKIDMRRDLARRFGLIEEVDRAAQVVQRCGHKVRSSCFVARHYAHFR
ncbi:hypothetical protein [Sphingomonas flavescens]|uniref:hypothetical protein n=1 Tax=Sphingomonas flavescens TaxID=3132797 RepID=UPI0028061A36|nr:hypothetical protein [Sphingomonas limnosediminicola]